MKRINNSKIILILIAIFSIIYIIVSYSNSVKNIFFYKEIINITVIQGKWVCVEGIYFYKNISKHRQNIGLRTPFPVNKTHHYPSYISLEEIKQGDLKIINYSVFCGNLFNELNFLPGEEKIIVLNYKQRTDENNGTYIIKTTRSWKRPLKVAYYNITIPDNLKLISTSYKWDMEEKVEGSRIYHYIRKDFFPDKDLDFCWTECKGEKE